MMFKLTDLKTEGDVLGGPVSEDNVYLRAYGKVLPTIEIDAHGNYVEVMKRHTELKVGESILMDFNLSGSLGTYRCTRIE